MEHNSNTWRNLFRGTIFFRKTTVARRNPTWPRLRPVTRRGGVTMYVWWTVAVLRGKADWGQRSRQIMEEAIVRSF
jgi:hypothetical protein